MFSHLFHKIALLALVELRVKTGSFTQRNIVVYSIKAKFHYAILVADRSEAGRRPVSNLLARASLLLAS